jgi:hypothetical protein
MIQKPIRGMQLNRTHPLSRGLVACYIFNEVTGETVFDLSGYGNNGTLENGVVWSDGGLVFDGNNGYVDLGNESSLKPSLPITISLWVELNELSDFRWIFRNDDDVNYYGVWLAKTANNFQVSYLDGGAPGSAGRRSKQGTTPLSANTWYHVAAVIRGATDMSIYVNGVDDEGTYSGTGGELVYSSSSGSIGKSIDSYFNGSIRSVNIYNQAKSADEITWLYREPYAMFEPAFNPAILYSPTVIMNQFQCANLGADLYNGVFA